MNEVHDKVSGYKQEYQVSQGGKTVKSKEVVEDVLFFAGLAGLGFGVYDLWGTGWAAIAVSAILLAISIFGAITRDTSKPAE